MAWWEKLIDAVKIGTNFIPGVGPAISAGITTADKFYDASRGSSMPINYSNNTARNDAFYYGGNNAAPGNMPFMPGGSSIVSNQTNGNTMATLLRLLGTGSKNPLEGVKIPGVGGAGTAGGSYDYPWYEDIWNWIKGNKDFTVPAITAIVGGIAGYPKSKAELEALKAQTGGQNLQNAIAAILLNKQKLFQPSQEIAAKMLPEALQGQDPVTKYLATLGQRPVTFTPELLAKMRLGS